jgi:hypothetical protein
MESDHRFVSDGTVFQDGETGPEPVDIGKALFAVPLRGARPGVKRAAAQIKALEPFAAGSPEEVFRKADLRITGSYRDSEGREITVDIPVTDARDYTTDRLTQRHDGLHREYVGSCTAETVAAELAGSSQGPLSEAQTQALEAALADLEAADRVEAS